MSSFKTDYQYDAQQFHQCYAYAINTLNTRLAVERIWPTYDNFYKQTKLNYEMYALELQCERILPLY